MQTSNPKPETLSPKLLAQGQILVSVNGSFEAPNGVVFELPGGFEGEMFAGISGETGRVRYNLGDTPFAHAPPAADFEAFCSVTPET